MPKRSVRWKKLGVNNMRSVILQNLGSKVNITVVYWNNQNYFGLGAGASGYALGDARRYKNRGPIQHYLKSLKNDQLPVLQE